MLDYLVTSKARRRLLRLLWAEKVKAPVFHLAELGGLNYRSAHKELNRMLCAGLASRSIVGNATVFEADFDHPQADLVRALVADSASGSAKRRVRQAKAEDERTRSWLAACGAPLHANPAEEEPPSLENLVVRSARLARSDVSVARSMPVFVWRHRQDLDFRLLYLEAHQLAEKRTVGFFLALTGILASDSELLDAAEKFRDRRVKKTVDFFVRSHSPSERRLAEARTPTVAKDWLFRMNMTMESFASTFARFVLDASV